MTAKEVGDAANTATVLMPFPSLAGGGENDRFTRAKLKIIDNGKAILSADVTVGEFGIGKDGALDLNGKVLNAGRAILTKSDGALSKLKEGTYTAEQLNEITGTTIYSDSVGGGSIVVKNTGLLLLVK